jgi:hypothetical protein
MELQKEGLSEAKFTGGRGLRSGAEVNLPMNSRK